jgi:hypothetical protein
MLLNLTLFALVIIFVVGVIKYLLHVKAFLNRIESAYPQLWLQMGMPKLNFQFGDTRYRKAMNYIRKREFKELNDDTLESEYKKILFLERMGLVFFISFFSLSIFQAIMGA